MYLTNSSEIKPGNIVIINGRDRRVVLSNYNEIINFDNGEKLYIEREKNSEKDKFIWIDAKDTIKVKYVCVELE